MVIVNLAARSFELHVSPDGDRYADVRTLRAVDTAQIPSLADLSFVIADILPAA